MIETKTKSTIIQDKHGTAKRENTTPSLTYTHQMWKCRACNYIHIRCLLLSFFFLLSFSYICMRHWCLLPVCSTHCFTCWAIETTRKKRVHNNCGQYFMFSFNFVLISNFIQLFTLPLIQRCQKFSHQHQICLSLWFHRTNDEKNGTEINEQMNLFKCCWAFKTNYNMNVEACRRTQKND